MKNLYFITYFWLICRTYAVNFFYFAPRLDSGYALKSKNLASGACGYLQGFAVFKKSLIEMRLYLFFFNLIRK
jgi:hypothetical protein